MKITTLVALVNIAIWISVAVAIIFAIATLHTAKPLWAFLIPAFSMLTFKKEGPEEDISQYDNKKQDTGRKTGHWIHYNENDDFTEGWSCSCCNHDITENPIFNNTRTGEPLNFVFCPYCGSQMNGVSEYIERSIDDEKNVRNDAK